MEDVLLAKEPWVRLAVYASVFVVMAVGELWRPRRGSEPRRIQRWPGNIGVFLIDILVSRTLLPAGIVGFALWTEQHGIGLFNAVPVPGWLATLASVLALDLIVYFQHRAFHAQPLLWRLHRMHHADRHFDVTTGTRFHPMEIVISLGIKLACVAVLGAPAIAVLIFEVLLNATSVFNHANATIPARIDAALRSVVVTPDMHRVHHSVVAGEMNSNFGFCLPWWDRLFATYRADPAAGHDAMRIGVAEFAGSDEQRLDRLLTHPFRDGTAARRDGLPADE